MSVPVYRLSKLPHTFVLYTRRGIILVKKSEVERFVKNDVFTPNPYWRHSGLLSSSEIKKFMDRTENVLTLVRIARYIVIWAENMVFTAWLMIRMVEGEEEAESYAESMIPFLEKLREMYKEVEKSARREIVEKMIEECIRVGLDPL